MKGRIGRPLDSHSTKNIKLQNQVTTRYYFFTKWRVGEFGGHPILNHHQMKVWRNKWSSDFLSPIVAGLENWAPPNLPYPKNLGLENQMVA